MQSLFAITFVLFLLKLSAGKGFYNSPFFFLVDSRPIHPDSTTKSISYSLPLYIRACWLPHHCWHQFHCQPYRRFVVLVVWKKHAYLRRRVIKCSIYNASYPSFHDITLQDYFCVIFTQISVQTLSMMSAERYKSFCTKENIVACWQCKIWW